MRVTILEGTPKEILEAAPDLFAELGNKHTSQTADVIEPNASSQNADIDTEDDSLEAVSVDYELARAILTRLEVPASVKVILKSLVSAHPEYVSANDLMDELEVSTAQFRGIMGSFGRRISYTENYNGEWFFDQEWVEEDGAYKYRLPDGVLRAIKNLGLD